MNKCQNLVFKTQESFCKCISSVYYGLLCNHKFLNSYHDYSYSLFWIYDWKLFFRLNGQMYLNGRIIYPNGQRFLLYDQM